MATLTIADWIIIAVLVIVAAVVIYFLTPLAIAIAIIAAAYFIYRWYTGHRTVTV
ncbi:MAG TPA: hypothetical protein VJL54_01890 [Nitrososphaera sp.]|jgi:hypothetical protein|nr:hypothetical protein [Nitrososphaera sp.]